jgi:hypothetical protein
MAKTFYTERDIEDLFAGGQTSLELTDDVVITDLARERANQIGFILIREHDKPSSAPERPYLAKQIQNKEKISQAKFTLPSIKQNVNSVVNPSPPALKQNQLSIALNPMEKKIYSAVMAKLDDSVNPNMLASIIKRVLQNVGGN